MQGNRVKVSVRGLHHSGDLKKMPGEDVELTCVATGKLQSMQNATFALEIIIIFSRSLISIYKTKIQAKW